ncbi:BlaI/MecI/CopY family transcriptional regulator [Kibdelosporangium philippinense]|uniref:BlaI/MecI/CopY family transcriptional regulator n=1 Tax=Kibdelosporangium philippinense TaxID=211113 RepID=A0ABS8Z6W4_9PSEU|nr:BlaI/MecI/CopY family transcriptional regulator [Kibdelosporangium philippinense]MCE7003623.1 BlaI/MecI/CopY family transcriptional regulator [Kibdelosporangium philippinense]
MTESADRRQRRKPGALSAEILDALSKSDEALTPGEILAVLPDGLSYSAVVTTLTRLHEKEVVTRERDGRAYRYRATGDQTALVAWRMGRILETEADHASVLTRFVGALNEQDEQLLRDLLNKDKG